ncbi:MAG TPA: DUF1553 domain-containing protein [Bryobacteraceae bacterium]|nr:DUF1553 domain-containing protein [Bryobacteraceae bacterium]
MGPVMFAPLSRIRLVPGGGASLGILVTSTALFCLSPVTFAADALPVRPIDPAQAAQVSYSHQVRPIFQQKCAMCHSADAMTSGFEAVTYDGLLKGGKKAGPAIIPGKPDESPLVEYLRGVRQPRMPNGQPPLSADELHIIRSWISAGAKNDSPADASATEAKTNVPEHYSKELWNVAPFTENSETLLIRRRAERLALVPKPPDPPDVDPALTNPIDKFIVAKWKQAKLPEATHYPPVVSDPVFLRRAYLDIIGVIPTIEESQDFLNDKSPDKREKLVDSLLARNADYAADWTPFFEEAIASSDTGVVGGIVRHGNYRPWIYESFLHDKPYDVMVAELIDPTMPGAFHPKTATGAGDVVLHPNYILNGDHDQTVQTAANVAQTFLGTGMKCASCHNHFLNAEWPQARVMAFAGLFTAKDVEIIRCEARSGKYAPAKFPFDLPDAPRTAPQDVASRLHRVAQLLTDPTDDRFSKTIVNRLWKRYFGLGLFEPADDFRADRPPVNPELLNWLAYDFMAHGDDLKHTIRLILTSRTYQLVYNPKLEDIYNVAQPDAARYYRSPSLRRLTAEELLDSIRVATHQNLDPKQRLYLSTTSSDLTRALGRPASRNEVSTGRSEEVAVVQALELLNGKQFHDLVYSGPILTEQPTIDKLYWAAFNRAPTAAERQAGEDFLKAQSESTDTWGDMLWAMFTSPAFQYVN